MNNNEIILKLKEALAFSPDNVALRMHLADTLMSQNNFEEAEQEFKTVLDKSKGNSAAKCGYAKCCFLQQKKSLAFVLLEDVCKEDSVAAEYNLMFSRLLFSDNLIEQARIQYKLAVEKDKNVSDAELDAHFRQRNIDENILENDSVNWIEKSEINFNHVGGMDKVKEEIQLKIIHPLQHPELYKAYGKKIGGGILLYGPPGCGKTHIARATAGQVNAKFISVGINDILDMWIGNSEKNLHEIFELARKNTPCVLFFDEVDALGANRSDMKQSAGRHLINQFLSEMDGINSSNEGVLILAATNAPWHLDPAFRRPGRFDRIIFVQPPDNRARIDILKMLLAEKPHESNIKYDDIVAKMNEFSGADMKSFIDMVVEEKLKESFKTGFPSPITNKDLLQAIKLVPCSTREWFVSARNYALYANESGLYDPILEYLKIKK